MTIYEAIQTAWRQPLLAVLFLELTLQMALIIAAFRDGRNRREKLPLLCHFAAGCIIFWLVLTDISCYINFPEGLAVLPGWIRAFSLLPAWAPAAYELVSAGILVFAVRDAVRYRGGHVTPDSVKETMDLLPVGIAFGRPDGTVLFRNLVMDRLSRALTGKLLTDFNGFRAAAGGEREQAQVSLPEEVWQIDVKETTVGNEPLLQLTAAEITEQAAITKELEEKNRKLRDLHLRLEMYSRQADRIIIAQELLSARMTVHNELGNVLLESRHCLNDPASIDEGVLLQALKNTNTYLLREYEQDDTAVDPLAEAVETAGAIGVKVTLTGIPPAEGSPRVILAAAIRECATNAVKHAEGDRLRADISRTDAGFRIVLRSNGNPPEGPILETGGLRSLRALVENHAGSMRIDTCPEVRMTITVE